MGDEGHNDGGDDEHRHKKRRINICTKENEEEERYGYTANRNAKERAEKLQKEANDQRRRENIAAHQM